MFDQNGMSFLLPEELRYPFGEEVLESRLSSAQSERSSPIIADVPLQTNSLNTFTVGQSDVGASPTVFNPQLSSDSFRTSNEDLFQEISAPANSSQIQPVPLEREFSVNFDENFTPEAQRAFQFAADIVDSYLDLEVPVEINASFRDDGSLEENGLAVAAPTAFGPLNSAVPEEVLGSVAQFNEIAGEDSFDGAEAQVVFNSNSDINFFFGNDGADIGDDQFDFVSLAIQEIVTGLGFIDSFTVDPSNGLGQLIFGVPTLFDFFVEDGAGRPLLSFDDFSTELGDQLTSNNLFFDGSNPTPLDDFGGGGNATEAFNGARPQLFAPADNGGLGISHLDEDAFNPGNGNEVLTPLFDEGEVIRDIGPVVLGIIEDLGFTLASPLEQASFEAFAREEFGLFNDIVPLPVDV